MSTGSATKPRRSSRQSTPTMSPPPSGGRRLPPSASTPSLSALAAPGSVRKSNRAPSPGPAQTGRPALPAKSANLLMEGWKGKLHKVKTQTLHLGDKSVDGTITIARVKCPVPKGVPGHIIKRFDTDAVSASSLFRAAFPTATDAEEQTEMRWVAKGSRQRYGDTKKAGAEHDESRKLSGTWVPSANAKTLAEEYGILKFAIDLIEYPLPGVDTIEIVDSDNDVATSPRQSKRARVGSPLSTVGAPQALSGISTNGVSILQTLATDPETSITTETTEVTVAVPEPTGGLAASEQAIADQIEQAKALVESLKAGGALPSLTSVTKKRALEEDEMEEALPTSGTLADTRGFFGKILKRAPARRGAAPLTASREIRSPGSQVARLERNGVEDRRWIAGIGLGLAVISTAAAPYLFG